MTRYRTYHELSRHETLGVDYRIRFREGTSGIAVMAVHGGDIEPGTTEIADAVAGDRHTFYTFSGLKPAGNGVLHLASRHFDEPCGVGLARDSRVVVTIHGCSDERPIVYLGGRHDTLKERCREALSAAGFTVGESVRFPGRHPDNTCNRGRQAMGVQLEISAGLRRRMFGSLKRAHRVQPLPAFGRLVAAVGSALDAALSSWPAATGLSTDTTTGGER
jgi:phage replication-related protein YjqB (UPF0714/DUF867 family)